MPAVDAISDIKSSVSNNGPDEYEFRALTEREKQQFVSLADSNARRLLAEQATNSIEENEVFAGRELQAVPPIEQPLVPELESSRCLVPIRNLEFQFHQAATSMHRRDPSMVLQFVLPPLVFAVVFLLVLIFYPLSDASLPGNVNLTDRIKLSDSDASEIVTATPDLASATTGTSARDIPVQTEVEVGPQTQEPAKPGPVQASPQISGKVEPTVRKTKAPASSTRKQGPQRSAQLTRPTWLTEPAWAQNADSFMSYLFFGR